MREGTQHRLETLTGMLDVIVTFYNQTNGVLEATVVEMSTAHRLLLAFEAIDNLIEKRCSFLLFGSVVQLFN